MAASIRLEHVSKQFQAGAVRAVEDVSLNIAAGEFFALLGPSGCGKTTLLRMIAGLETPTHGRVFIHDAEVTGLPPHRNPSNLVFQHYALFPHLNVEHNVGFGLRYRGLRGADAKSRIAEALSLVRLSGYENRRPDQLSGGQKQRVALARALVLRPKVLLLDEPFGALDQKLRREMQIELKALQRTLGITFVFVTHDQEEALTMSDRIAVMNAGRVEQVDASETVFEKPRTRFVADFMGAANFMTSRTGRTFVVRPEKLNLNAIHSAGSIEVVVVSRAYQGASTLWTVRTRHGEILTIISAGGQFETGATAYVSWNPCHEVVLA